MRRSLRRIGYQEIPAYTETQPLFTVSTLDEAKQRLLAEGREPSRHCVFSWVFNGVRYFRVWEDKRLQATIARDVPFGQVACTLKRAEAEKLYIKARRHSGNGVVFAFRDGTLQVLDPAGEIVQAAISVPITGGALIFEPAAWSERQAAHFINALLVRDYPPDLAYAEAETLQADEDPDR
jgi:hypothetical protein